MNTREAEVRRLLGSVLETEPVTAPADTRLSALGVDSLRAVELRGLLADEAGVEVPLATLLSGATIADLTGAAPVSSPPGGAAGPGPLTRGEESMWFLDEYGDQTGRATSVVCAVAISGPLDVAGFRSTVDVLASRHAALRTRVEVTPDGPRRVVGASAVSVDVVDATARSDADVLDECARLADEPVALTGPTWRLTLLRVGADRHVLVLRTHHLLADLWSLGVLLTDFAEVYPGAGGGSPRQADMSVVAARERALLESPRAERLREYWRSRLAGAPAELALPLDHERPARPRHRGADVRAELDPTGVRALAAELAVSVGSVLLAAYGWVLARYCGHQDLVVGAVFAGRDESWQRELVGYLANVLPIRQTTAGTFAAHVRRVHDAWGAAVAHGALPFSEIVAGTTGAALVRALFAFQRAGAGGAAALAMGDAGHAVHVGPLTLRPWPLATRPAPADVALEVADHGETLSLRLTHDVEVLDTETAQRLLAAVRAVLDRPHARFVAATAPGPEETHRLLWTWNTSGSRTGSRADEPFWRWAGAHPDAPALVDGARSLSYGQTAAVAEKLAESLCARGAGPDVRVGVHIGRSADFVVAVLGVLRAGAAYVPLDPDLPAARLDEIRAEAGVRLEVTLGAPGSFTVTGTAGPPGGGDLCYVMCTSGSTGTPKAVGVPHGAVAALLADFHDRGTLPPGSRCAWWTSTGFDVSVYEILAAFDVGGVVVVVPERVRVDGAELAAWSREARIESAFVPPFALTEFVADLERNGAPPLRRLLLGVEPIAAPLARRLVATLPDTVVVNAYGPTEATVMCTAYPVPAEPGGGRLPIGRALTTTRAYVLDEHLAPQGAVGELHIGGDQLARGYLGRPAATAARFVPDPFAGRPGARMYRTGDLVRYRTDGQLEFVGRADQQVKLFGQRVELGEVEAVLTRHPAVAEAVAFVVGTGSARHLAAAVLAATDPPATDPPATDPPATDPPATGSHTDEVLAMARELLPRHLVPAHLRWLPAWPLTANGKIDRGALAALGAPGRPTPAPHGSPLVRRVGAVLARELGVAAVGPDDDFFALGGHSLAAARVAVRLRAELGVELPVASVFAHPTAARLAEQAARAVPPAPVLVRRPRGQASINAMTGGDRSKGNTDDDVH